MSTHQLAGMFLALGTGLIIWAGHDLFMGVTHVDSTERVLGDPVRQDDDPAQFRRLIIANIIGGVVCAAIAGFLFVAG